VRSDGSVIEFRPERVRVQQIARLVTAGAGIGLNARDQLDIEVE
jgi:hypothetical protein